MPPAAQAAMLTDADLEAVSGGWGNEEWEKCENKYHYLSR